MVCRFVNRRTAPRSHHAHAPIHPRVAEYSLETDVVARLALTVSELRPVTAEALVQSHDERLMFCLLHFSFADFHK